MCLAVPAQIIEILPDEMGLVDHAGNQRKISLMLLEDPKAGDYVIIHAGFAIHQIDEAAAKESIQYIEQLATQLPPGYDPNTDF